MPFAILRRHVCRLATKAISATSLLVCLLSASPVLANDPPSIQSMSVVYYGEGWWGVYGVVDDENPSNCEVIFSGVLEGYSTDVSSNGEFILFLQLPQTLTGSFGAEALDSEYQWSDPASDLIGSLN